MREVKRSALINKAPAEVFALINDIESYPQFLPWCTHARIESRNGSGMVAPLGVREGALQGEFTTRNTLEPPRRIHMQLLTGPFRKLEGEWLLTPIDGGCRLELNMRFAFRNPLAGLLLEPKFAATIGSLVEAFAARARSQR